MRMHTIPQNVTAYEDKIVGMLIGRQFIYLAIGGVTIFVLLSADIGPLFIRVFISLVVGLFSAALALLKLNDRGFDSLVLSYIKAMFGPTEWVWRKDILPMSKLSVVISPDVSTTKIASQTSSSATKNSKYQQNLQRVSRYQTFISQRETSTLDEDEWQFIERLNFSEPVPQSAFDAASESKPAPPMLTKSNFTQVKTSSKPDPIVFSAPQPEPITRIAGSSAKSSMTIDVDGRNQSISLRHNQRTNRSLSKHLISAGVMPLPVRGEIHFDITPELKNELTSIKNVAPAEAKAVPQTNLAGYPVSQQDGATQQNQTQVVNTAPPPTPVSQRSTPHNAIDYAEDWAKKATVRQQIAALGQATSISGITNGVTMSDSQPNSLPTPAPSDNQQQSLPNMTGSNDVKIIKDKDLISSSTDITPDVQQQLSQVEGQTRQAISDLDKDSQTAATSTSPAENQPESSATQSSTPAQLTEKAQELSARIRQVEATISQLQQTMLPGQDQTQLTEHQQLLNKLQAEKQQVETQLQDLGRQNSEGHVGQPHTKFQPVPQVPPVIKEPAQPLTPPSSQSDSRPTQQSTPAPQPAPTPQLAGISSAQAQPTNTNLDLQDKMAAAGVGMVGGAAPTTTTPSTASAQSSQSSQMLSMTKEPNIINGRVLDSQGQSLPGVVVVVKNSQGEPKRALKTNKLGQFVVTTPLANGSYIVEVDKKGLSFDIMNVELTGAVLSPMEIRPK